MPSNYRDYPDCPECASDVFVERSKRATDYVCWACEETFDAATVASSDRRRPEWVLRR